MNRNVIPSAIVAVMLVSIHSLAFCQQTKITFKKLVLFEGFVSEGVAAGDVNGDGLIDIMAGPYWFKAPNWERSELFEVQQFNAKKGYSNSMLNFALDVNLDGWVDLIRIDFPGKAAYWHENPKNRKGHWKVHTIYERVGNESPAFVDVDGDGREDLIFGDPLNNQMIWLKSPVSKENLEWKKFTISEENVEGTKKFAHGLGFGDINGDGRNDVFVKQGWWEGPEDVRQHGWRFHPTNFGEDCAQMYVYDIDSDGDNDLISSSAHYSGIWWFEQTQENNEIRWTRHLVSQTIAETHALILADIDSDGRMDLITGNRYYAHNSDDPADHGPPVISWYTFQPDKKPNPKWTEYRIDDESGVGLNIVAKDINGDGFIDIAIANKNGIYLFIQQREQFSE
jgi:hypothetical protein